MAVFWFLRFPKVKEYPFRHTETVSGYNLACNRVLMLVLGLKIAYFDRK